MRVFKEFIELFDSSRKREFCVYFTVLRSLGLKSAMAKKVKEKV